MARFKWTVEFEVDESIVEDGFDLTDDRANDMLRNNLPYAFGSELGAKVIKAPDHRVIRKIQGFDDE